MSKEKRLSYYILLVIAFVTIAATSCAEGLFIHDPDAVEEAANSVFMLKVYAEGDQIAVGSGFVAFDSSTLVTNYHVIEDATYIIAISDDMNQYTIQNVCTYNRDLDIAILHFDHPTEALPLEFDSERELKRSESVVAIGSPAGLINTVSLGNISSFYKHDGKDWIQFTAPISSGSSGGVLLSDEGKVIGMTTAIYASTQNINLAVRASYISELYHDWDRSQLSPLSSITGASLVAIATTPVFFPEVSTSTDQIVWVTQTGNKYHSNASCSGMKSPMSLQLHEAIEKGYDPCGKCYK